MRIRFSPVECGLTFCIFVNIYRGERAKRSIVYVDLGHDISTATVRMRVHVTMKRYRITNSTLSMISLTSSKKVIFPTFKHAHVSTLADRGVAAATLDMQSEH